MSKSVWFALATTAALLSGATGAVAGDGSKSNRKPAKQKSRQRRAVSADVASFLAALQPTDEQRTLLATKARAAGPLVAAARQEARRVVANAMEAAAKDGAKPDRKSVRAAARVEIKSILERARAQVEPLAREVVASFTAEQRESLRGLAGKRGKPVDDARLAKFVGRLISRPTAAASFATP